MISEESPPRVGGNADAPVALITGGEGDLAGEISKVLRSKGYTVLAPGKATLDVSDPDSVAAYFKSHLRLSLLINNAGITRDSVFAKLDEVNFDRVLDVNLKGAFLCCRSAARAMLKTGGHIINIGSFSALSPPVGQANYAAAKAGLIGLTQSLAEEFGGRNIRVNCVLPGFLETKMTRHLPEAARERAADAHVLRRFNTVEDAARFIAFLDSMGHVSGQIFQLDSRITRWC